MRDDLSGFMSLAFFATGSVLSAVVAAVLVGSGR